MIDGEKQRAVSEDLLRGAQAVLSRARRDAGISDYRVQLLRGVLEGSRRVRSGDEESGGIGCLSEDGPKTCLLAGAGQLRGRLAFRKDQTRGEATSTPRAWGARKVKGE